MQRSWIWLLVAAPMVLMVSFFVLMLTDGGDSERRASGVRVSGEAAIGGPFTLIDHTGRTVTDADYRGRAMLIYFGYTYCPDICPFSLQVMTAALDRLSEEERAHFQPMLITVDPHRDTAGQLAAYVSSPAFPDNLVGLTGSDEQIRDITAAYRVVFQPGEGEDYLVDHTSFIYLMDAEGRFADVFSHGVDPAVLVDRLRAYLEDRS